MIYTMLYKYFRPLVLPNYFIVAMLAGHGIGLYYVSYVRWPFFACATLHMEYYCTP